MGVGGGVLEGGLVLTSEDGICSAQTLLSDERNAQWEKIKQCLDRFILASFSVLEEHFYSFGSL